MLEHTSFTFKGVSTEQLGLVMVQKSGGLYEESFLSNRKINTTSIYKRKKRYFKGAEVEPLSFSFSIWIKDWKDRRNLRAIARWLNTDGYQPLWFNDEPDKVYYCMIDGDSKLIHNGNYEGTIDVTFTCDSEYAHSHPKTHNFSVNGVESWQFLNDGDATVYPFLKITQKENKRPIIIRNVTLGAEFILNDVLLGEQVFIDCENRIIESDRENNIRYLHDSHNGYWLPFPEDTSGITTPEYAIEYEGNFDIDFTFEYKYLQQGDGF